MVELSHNCSDCSEINSSECDENSLKNGEQFMVSFAHRKLEYITENTYILMCVQSLRVRLLYKIKPRKYPKFIPKNVNTLQYIQSHAERYLL